ncbi:MAG: nitroreductase [Bacteroidaceae bacterium]|nr:nitroreductase [Bacteroidaceae bacterium]
MGNKFIENLRTRRSIRAYIEKMPPMESIKNVAEAGTYAPNGQGKQSARIIVVTDKDVRDRLSRMNAAILGISADPFHGAPVIIIVLADKSVPTYICDGALVIGNILNAAHAEGLAGCWIHRAKEMFTSKEGKEFLYKWGIKEDCEGIGCCAIGYSSDEELPHPRPRKKDYIIYV